MTRVSEVWKRLEENKNRITIYISLLIIVGVITATILIPAAQTMWYIATTDIEHVPYDDFKNCPPLNEGFVIEEDVFAVDKQIWFCLDEQIPKKTYISEENAGRIDPAHETDDIVVYFLKSNELAHNWKLIASAE